MNFDEQSEPQHYDVVIIGAGPAGQNAAIQAAKSDRDVLVVDRGRAIGGSCVHQGTIPSKTMHQVASHLLGLNDLLGVRESMSAEERATEGYPVHTSLPHEVRMATLLRRLNQVVKAHQRYMGERLEKFGVEISHAAARFESPNRLQLLTPRRDERTVTADVVVVATGSRPRLPDGIDVDHEHVVDSDSVLSMTWLPRTLTVLGGGVIASEYASIFAALGAEVTIVDRASRPLAFLDEDLSRRFVERFEKFPGCTYLGSRDIRRAAWDGARECEVVLGDGEVIRSEKVFCALGRVANIDRLQIEAAGIELTERGLIKADEYCRTSVPNIYAVGDVIGHPALASTAMEQGRRAARHALGLPVGDSARTIPVGIYTVPEISTVGMSEAEAKEKFGGSLVGEARFDEVARAQISGSTDGYIKIVCDPDGKQILGVQIFGEGATELVHTGQMAMVGHIPIDALIENIFNFPTLHEAYRVAALDVIRKREALAPQPV